MAQAAQRIAYPPLAVLPGGAPAHERIAAVIDLGSNSWRLVIFAYVPGASWRRVGELQEPVRIAEGLSGSGSLKPNAIARGLETLEMFGRYLEARGVAPAAVDAVATSAIRDAANGADLLAVAQERTGLSIGVLSAEEEARLGYVAAVNSTTLADGVVLDLGGGSLQLTAVAGRQAQQSASWPLGAVRVTEQYLPSSRPPSRKQLKQARAAIREQLARRRLARRQRRPARRHGRRRPQPRRRRAGRRPRRRHPGLRARARPAGRARGRPRQAPRVAARAAGHQDRARRHRARRCARARARSLELGGFDGIEVTRAGLREGVFFQPPPAQRVLAAARRRARRLDPQPRAPVRRRHRPRRPRRAAGAAAARLARGREACSRPRRASAGCCGRPRSCTTSA